MKKMIILYKKQLIISFFILSVAFCLFFYISNRPYTFEACVISNEVIDKSGDSIIVYRTDTGENLRLCRLFVANLVNDKNVLTAENGEIIKVTLSPLIQYYNLPVYPNVYRIKKLNRADEKLYQEGSKLYLSFS